VKKLLFGLTALSSSAMAADWQYVDKGSDGSVLYVDNASIVRSRNRGQAWVEFDYSKVKSVRHRSSKELWKFNCVARTSFTASWVDYAVNGSVIRSRSPIETEYDYKPVVPDSLGETVMELVCNDPAPGFDPSKPFTSETAK
jgi:hypothetical protein